MTWESETSDEIKFISPELNEFYAKWIANERSGEKKLGIFDPPNVKGSFIQDLDTKSTKYPLTVYFDGPFHFKDANKFWDALDTEKGQWEITHPTKGVLILQLSTFSEVVDPVNSGNVTVFNTEWLEPANIGILVSAPELGALTLLSVLNTINDALVMVNQLKADLYSAVQSALNVMNQVAGLADSIMAELAALDALVNDSWSEAKNSFNNLKTMFQNDPSNSEIQSDLAQSVIDIISIPLQSTSDYTTRMSKYSDLLESIYTLKPESNSDEDYNKSVSLELSITGILISISRIIATSDFKTRAEVISAMDKTTTLYNDAVNFLESIQENF